MTPRRRDQGAALILTLFATTLVMILGTTILSVTVNNLRTATLAKDSAVALDAADAGVAQASAYLRTFGVRAIACSPGCPSGYGSRDNPTSVTLPGGASYRVWVEGLAPLPGNNPGRYLIHSTGRARDGVRTIEAEVAIGTRPLGLPLALFARSFDGGGNGAVFQESILTTGCVWSRGHINVSGTDVAYGIPAAVHSSQYISTSNGSTGNCLPSNGAIHRGGPCNTNYPYDQSVQGGLLPTSTSCHGATMPHPAFYAQSIVEGTGSSDRRTSKIIDETTLRRLFSIPDKPFTDAQLDQLRQVAQTQGNYWTSNAYSPPNPAYPHGVLFFDLTAGGNTGQRVDLEVPNGSVWNRATTTAGSTACVDASLLVIVVGGDVKLNANRRLVANIVLTSSAPYGKMNKLNGTAELIGTVYADAMDLTGTGDVKLDTCFVQNLSPSLVDTTLTTTHYREVDRTG